MVEADYGDSTLMLGQTRGDDRTSPPPPDPLAPPEAEEGRITVTRTGSPIAAEGRAFLRGREIPPPIQRKTLTLSKEKDSLSEAPP